MERAFGPCSNSFGLCNRVPGRSQPVVAPNRQSDRSCPELADSSYLGVVLRSTYGGNELMAPSQWCGTTIQCGSYSEMPFCVPAHRVAR